jgi:hypothetical protein
MAVSKVCVNVPAPKKKPYKIYETYHNTVVKEKLISEVKMF